MRQPIFENGGAAAVKKTAVFGGLCRTEEIKENEACEMKNMSSFCYPFLAPCKGRQKVCDVTEAECMIAPRLVPQGSVTSFTGVANDKFYYNGEQKLTLAAQQRRRNMIDFNGNILIFPDRKYYSYVDGSGGDIAESVSGSVKFVKADDNNLCKLIFSEGFDGKFKVGDSLTIACSEESNCTHETATKYKQTADGEIISCIVNKVLSDTTIAVRCIDKSGSNVSFVGGTFEDTSISRAMPEIVVGCVANNRVFGADEYGETIYASKPGDFKNWYAFEGLSTDSWYGNVGTEGEFVGMAALGSAVAAFKHNYIHMIYGETPSNFSIAKQINVGCADGRSIVEIRGQLYFLSYDGVYVFSGGNPVRVSAALGTDWGEGCAGTDGRRYYLSLQKGEKSELLTYDIERGLWHREDEFCAVGFIRYNNRLYAADGSGLYEMKAGAAGEWYAVMKQVDSGYSEQVGMVNLYIRAEMETGSVFCVSVSCEGEEFKLCVQYSAKKHAVWRVPVRFRSVGRYQLKLFGCGMVKILAIEEKIYAGGRDEANRARQGW